MEGNNGILLELRSAKRVEGRGRAYFEELQFDYSKKSKKHLKQNKLFLAEKKWD